MTPEELRKLEEEVAALESQVTKLGGKVEPTPKAEPVKRKRRATAPKAPADKGKNEMPPKGSTEWEAWQASQLQQSGHTGGTLLGKLKDALDQQVRRTGQLHMGTNEYLQAQGRCEGLACAIGVLRGTTMSGELRNAHNRIEGSEGG